MELQIMSLGPVEQADVPVAHRQSGAQVSALVEQLKTFGANSKKGEAFKVNVDNVLVFVTALRVAATELNSGVRIRKELVDPDKETTNRKGETVIDERQGGTVYFWFADKRKVAPGSKTPGRKPAAKR